MTTPDLLFPDTRPPNADGETRNVERAIPRSAPGGSHARGEFASLMNRALDAEPAKAHSSPGTQDAKKAGNAPSSRAFAGKGKGRKAQIDDKPSGDVDGCESAPPADAIGNEEIQGNAGSKNRTTVTTSSSDAEQAGEPVDESAPEAEPESAPASAGDALAPNIIILPPPTVIIPFPVALTVEAGGSTVVGDSSGLAIDPAESGQAALEQSVSAQTNEGKIISFSAEPATSRAPATDETKEGGIDVTRLKMLPEETDELHADNIKVIDFRQPAEAKIIRLPLAAAFGTEHGARNTESADSPPLPAVPPPEVSEETAVSQLPGDEGPPEEIAQLAMANRPAVRPPDNAKGFTKAMAHAGLARVHAVPTGSAEATGISTARQESRMDSMKNSGQGNAFAGRGQNGLDEFPPAAPESARAEVKVTDIADISPRISGAMDWQLGRPVGSFDRPSLPSPVLLTPEQSATVDRISNLLLRETSLVRQHSSDSMAVVLRPDDSTELYVHFARRNGQIEATIRCDRGDAHQLGALWPQLQESLAQQRVRLAPLQEGPLANANFNHPTGFGSSGEGSGSQRHSPSDRQSMDERSAPASSIPDVSHVRERGGSRRRLTTSRPGWETWA